MIHLKKILKPSLALQSKLLRLSHPVYTQTFKNSLFFKQQFDFAKISQYKVKQEIDFEKDDSSYKPLTGYQEVLQRSSQIASQTETRNYEALLNRYSSNFDLTSFHNEEVLGIFHSLYFIGKNLCENDQFIKAKEWYSHVLLFGKKAENLLSIDEIKIYHSIAKDFFSNGDEKSAEGYLIGARNIIQNISELNSETILLKAQNLILDGFMKNAKNEKGRAHDCFIQAANLINETPNLDHHSLVDEITVLYGILPGILYERGEQKEAEKHSIKGLNLYEKLYGKDCIQGKELASAITVALHQQRRFSDALVYAKKFKNIVAKELGKDHFESISARFLVAQITFEQEKYSETLEILKEVQKAVEQNPEAKKYFLYLYEYLTDCYAFTNQWEEAQKTLDKAIQWVPYYFGEISKETGDCIYRGAKAWSLNQNPQKAKELFEKALDIYRKVGASCNNEVVATCFNYGSFFLDREEIGEAIKWAQIGLEECKKRLPNNIDWFESLHNLLGWAQFKGKNFDESVMNLTKGAQFCEQLNNRSGKLFSHYNNLAQSYIGGKNLEKAEYFSKRSLEEAIKEFGEEDDTVLYLTENLCDILKQRGKEKDAEELRKQYLKN